MKAHIFKAEDYEIHKGWVRVPKEFRGNIPNEAYVRITVGGRKIYCQLRGMTKEYIDEHPRQADIRRLLAESKTLPITMNLHYREKLELDSSLDVEISLEKACFIQRVNAWYQHPDDMVRVSIGLALISVALGIISLAIALAALSITFNSQAGTSDVQIYLVITAVIVIFLLLIGAFALGLGTGFFKYPKR